jgi:hypothetical protein
MRSCSRPNALKACIRPVKRSVRTLPQRHGPRIARIREVVKPSSRAPHEPHHEPIASTSATPPSFPWTQYDQPTPTQPAQNAVEDSQAARVPVQIPDDPDGLVPPDHPAATLLSNSGLVVVRQLEMMNLFIGCVLRKAKI